MEAGYIARLKGRMERYKEARRKARLYRRESSRSKYLPHQSDRETARRRRQIAAGQLREQNGLVRGVSLD